MSVVSSMADYTVYQESSKVKDEDVTEAASETKPLLQEFEGHALKYATESLKTM